MRLCVFLVYISLATSLSAMTNNPHEWLENSEDIEVQNWIKQQRALFNKYIAENSPRNEIKQALEKLTHFDTYSIPQKVGNDYLYISKKASENQSKLYTQKGLKGTPRILVDPSLISTHTSLEHFILSPNGKYVAYNISEKGSDWMTCRVKDMESLLDLEDCVEKIKFSPVVWAPDSKGFFYSRFDEDNLHSIHYHALGTAFREDRLVYRDLSDSSVGYTPFISSDNRYLIIDAFAGSSGPNWMCLLDLESPGATPMTIIPKDGANYWFVSSKGTKLYFATTKNADRRKLIYIDLIDKKYAQQDFIPESALSLENFVPIGKYFCTVTSENVINRLTLFDDLGKFVKHIPLPSNGKININRVNQNTNRSGEELFFSFTNFFQPLTIYHYQLGSKTPEIFKESPVNNDSDSFVMQQVFYSSKDGTKVPMFVAHKKGIKLDGSNPTLLTGYGAYGISNYPIFTATRKFWLDQGGVLALANVRGGGEYGVSWHKGALRENKQNSFDDFIGAAEWLIANQYTKPARLAAIGMSSGGLLVAASANQRPDLFKAIVVEAGLLDMLRFPLFTIGRFWINEHGNPEDHHDFEYLSKYSPCHNVGKAAKYPSVLVTASEDDDRVVPSHSYKYVAALQSAYKDNKVLLRLSANQGHDSSNSSDAINERADILAFIYRELER